MPARAQGCMVVGGIVCDCDGGPKCCGGERCDCGWDGSNCTCICTVLPGESGEVCGPSSLTKLGMGFLQDPASSLLAPHEVLAANPLVPGILGTKAVEGSGGAYVDWVVKGSPAARAGLRQGDVIVRIGSTTVDTTAGVERALDATRGGQNIELAYVREGLQRTARAEVGGTISIFPRFRVPFVAKVAEERDWTQNGISFHETKQTVVYRDSAGREATEEFGPSRASGLRRTVHVFDPVEGINIIIHDADRSALVVDSRRPAGFVSKAKPHILHWSSRPSQYLGTQVIQGLLCEGYRRENILNNPAELGIVSPEPVVFITETWTSDLSLKPVLEIRENPLEGRVEWRMVDIRQNAIPDAGIFRVPAGYKVVERNFTDLGHGLQASYDGTSGSVVPAGN